MTEQNARERIADEVHRYGTAAVSFHETGHGLDTVNAVATADRILAIVRTAMLSDAALVELRFVDNLRDGMNAALDAVFGGEQ